MEFDWSVYGSIAQGGAPDRKQVEQSFEDPFNIRLMPDAKRFQGATRFFCLGKDDSGSHWTIVYTTNGKMMRVIAARSMSDDERSFYERKLRESL